MDSFQQRVIEIALQIPEYVGYAAKERRREVDRHLRRQLAAKYDAQRTRLARLQQRAGMEFVVEVEKLDQKLLRLIAQLNTAPRGYAGWFDAAQIGDADLEQLTQFDADLANGVTKLATALDQLTNAFKKKESVLDAIDACAETLDTLNAEFDQRDAFVAQGKKPSLDFATGARPSPLDALDAKKVTPREIVALTQLKLNDALTFEGTDYLTTGKLAFSAAGKTFFAFRLADGARHNWLRVGPADAVLWCDEIALRVAPPFPASLEHDQQNFSRAEAGTANVAVEGAGGSKRGAVTYARYTGELGSVLWLEEYGGELRALLGRAIDVTEVKVYRR